MPGRKYQAISASKYPFSINGQLKESDLNDNITTALYWEYDSRIGRRWNIDPKPNAGISNYATFFNNPNFHIDILGDSGTPNTLLNFLKPDKQSYDGSSWIGSPFGKSKTLIFAENSVTSAWNQGVGAVEAVPDNVKVIGNAFSKEGRRENAAIGLNLFMKAIRWWNSEPWKDVSNYEDAVGSAMLIRGVGIGIKRFPKLGKTQTNTENLIYRFDERSPSEIKKAGGFKAYGNNKSVLQHASGESIKNKTSNYVATSKSKTSAIEFADDREGYLYGIKNRGNGIDVNQVLGNLSPFPWEKEIAIPDGIPYTDIKFFKPINK